MKDVTNTTLTSQIMSTVEEGSELLPLVVDGGKYQIEKFDEVKAQVEHWLEEVDSYTYSEEDRQLIRSMNAAINRYNSELKSELNTTKKNMFGDAEEQIKEFTSLMLQLRAKLQTGLDDADKRLKQEKRKELQDKFIDIKANYEGLADMNLDLNDVLVPSWLNRTFSIKKAIDEMHSRMKSINLLALNEANPLKDVDDILDSLEVNDWDGLAALNDLQEREAERQRKILEAEVARQLKEKEEAEARLRKEAAEKSNAGLDELKKTEIKLPDVLIRIDGNDWERAQALLNAAGISYLKV